LGPAKESPVLAIELARAFVAELERRSCRIQFTREHAVPRRHETTKAVRETEAEAVAFVVCEGLV
jgi:hypothetical protein